MNVVLPVEFVAIGRIKQMLTECIAAQGSCGMHPWPDPPNAYYGQTSAGLFLEIDYGAPNTLQTPWGLHTLGGSSWSTGPAWDEITAQMLPRLGATLYREGRYDPSIGYISAVWALSKVDDLALPPAVARPYAEYVDHDEITRAWRALTSEVAP